MIVLLDNGHGRETCGKCSPDGRVKEWEYTRRMALAIASGLLCRGVEVHFVTPEDGDVPIPERCRRVNEICRERGTSNCLLVSLHLNAAGNGGAWMNASGWSVYVYTKAGNGSHRLAGCLFDEAAKRLKVRRPSHNQKFWTENLGICRGTLCTAVLTESLFMDNREDVARLLSDDGFDALAALHVEGIMNYINGIE